MSLITRENAIILWQDVIREAEQHCAITLDHQLESYLISLLVKYTNKPELAKTILAKILLESMQKEAYQRKQLLQDLGDQCLLFAGLFPNQANHHHVKITYFVHLGRSAYHTVSDTANDVFNALALQFVLLMDVLQSVPKYSELLPIEAYEQWSELGSQRAYRILKSYCRH